MRRFLTAVLLLCPLALRAQQITGVEQPVPYTGSYASIVPPNTPATSFSSPFGSNTFILPISNPTVAIRLYITNNTANQCLSTFNLTMFAASNTTATSFNGSIANWSNVAIQTANGLAGTVSLDIPASQSIYITSTAITAPRVAIQLVNPTGGCATTSIELFAVIIQVSTTAPLISNSNGAFTSSLSANIQGMVPTSANGQPIFPVVAGGLQTATNANFATFGVDTFSTALQAPAGGANVNLVLGTPPITTSSTNWALVAYSGLSAVGGTGLLSPWSCIVAVAACGASSGNTLSIAQLSNVNSSNKAIANFINTTATTGFTQFVVLNKTPTIRQATSSTTAGVTLAGSTLMVIQSCINFPCTVSSVTDTQGNVWRQVTSQQSSTGINFGGQSIWMSGSIGGADTVTINMASGVNSNAAFLELTGTAPTTLNQPSAPLSLGGAANSTGAPPANQLQTSGTFTSYSPVQLGVSALTEPAAGTSALSSIIDTRAAREAILKFSCTAGAVTVNVQTYAEDGVTALGLISPLSAVAAATNTDLTLGSESNPTASTGTVSTTALLRLPQRALAFSFTNAGGAGTCTARLMLSY